MPKGLTPKRVRFVEEYLLDLNATQAAIRAGYSKKTAPEIGYELLAVPLIAAAIAAAKELRSERTEIDQDEVVNFWYSVLKGELGDINAEGEISTVKLSDRINASDKLGKHLGLFEKDNSNNVNVFLTENKDKLPGWGE